MKRILQWRLRPQFKVGQRTDLIWTDYTQKGKDRFATQSDADLRNAKADEAMKSGDKSRTSRLFEYRLKP